MPVATPRQIAEVGRTGLFQFPWGSPEIEVRYPSQVYRSVSAALEGGGGRSSPWAQIAEAAAPLASRAVQVVAGRVARQRGVAVTGSWQPLTLAAGAPDNRSADHGAREKWGRHLLRVQSIIYMLSFENSFFPLRLFSNVFFGYG